MRSLAGVSDRLARSSIVSGVQSLPPLKESVLALTIVNHPALFFEDYDTIRQIEFESRDMRRFWQAMMGIAAASGPELTREELLGVTHAGLAGPIERSIDVHISRLRQKIEVDARDPVLVKTVRMGGYMFTAVVEEV